MTDRLLNLIEPQGLDRTARLIGWIAGGLVGSSIAAAALVFLLSHAHIG
jgi:hypothetical protein